MHAPFTKPVESTPAVFPQVLDGQGLAKAVRAATATEKALLAVELMHGVTVVQDLTAAQAKALTGASYGYTHAARCLSPLELAAVRDRRLMLGDVMRRRKLSDAKLEKIVTRLGIGRVWDAVDRLTR